MWQRSELIASWCPPSLFFLGGVGVFLGEDDALGVRRRIEDEGVIVERWRKVPGKRIGVLWPGFVSQRPNDELAWQGKLSELNPDLPIRSLLTEGIVLAGNVLYGAGANVDRGCELFGVVFIFSPSKEIDQREVDVVLVVCHIEELAYGRRRRHRSVVVDQPRPDAKIFPIVEVEPMPFIAGDFDA